MKSKNDKQKMASSKKVVKIPIDIKKFLEFVNIPTEEFYMTINYNEEIPIDPNDTTRVSTITSQYKNLKIFVDLESLKEKLLEKELLINEDFKYKEFKNQISLCISYNFLNKKRKLSIKCFKSGCVHVCGLKNMKMMNILLKVFSLMLKKLLNIDYVVDSMFINICLINVAIDCKQKLNLFKLRTKLAIDLKTYSYYEPTKYSGLIIKVMFSLEKVSTIIMFSSGKIMICARDVHDIKEMFLVINKILMSDKYQEIDMELCKKIIKRDLMF